MALTAVDKSKLQGSALDLATVSTVDDPSAININQIIQIVLTILAVVGPLLTPAHAASISSAVNKP